MNKKTLLIVGVMAAAGVLIYFLSRKQQEQQQTAYGIQNPYASLAEAIGGAVSSSTESARQLVDTIQRNKIMQKQQANEQANYNRRNSGLYSPDLLF